MRIEMTFFSYLIWNSLYVCPLSTQINVNLSPHVKKKKNCKIVIEMTPSSPAFNVQL